jgi:hypothetical protein
MMMLGDRRDASVPQASDTSLADVEPVDDEYPF